MGAFLKRLAREPLVHFLLLGAAIFAAFSFFSRDQARDPQEITVTQGKIENLATTFERTWQRPPTQSELQDLIREHVREEVAYREALNMGLDRDDSVIRRRLRQKLEFISEDLEALAEPSDEELRAYFASHASNYAAEPRFTFRHVYLSPERHGDALDRDVKELLARLPRSGDEDPAGFGDPFPLDNEFKSMSASQIASVFGEPFAARVAAMTPGDWRGPVESGFGVHLVHVVDRTEGGALSFEDVRDTVHRDWEAARRLEANEKFYEALLERYTVIVEGSSVIPRASAGGAR